METPAARAAEKKDKMDGNVFSDLGKKPSESRGKRVRPRRSRSLLRNRTLVSHLLGLSVAERVGGAQPEGKGAPARTMKYTFQRKSVDAPPAQSGSGSSQR